MKKYAKLTGNKLEFYICPSHITGSAVKIDALNNGYKIFVPSYSQGSIITFVENKTEIKEVRKLTFEELKQNKLNELMAYDSSEAVNQFSIGSDNMWLHKNERVSIKLTIDAVISEGIEIHTLWNVATGKSYTLPVESFVYMLMKLENYAYACFNTTAQHSVNINNIETEADLLSYDFTLNYPPKLQF